MDEPAFTRAFKAYDVRGRIPDELNEEILKRIGNAFAQFLRNHSPIDGPVLVGYDIRLTSKPFTKAFTKGVTDAGMEVIDIGLVGTDMVYFATAKYKCAGGVMITASHNPPDYNGLKFVREDAIAISSDTGLQDIRDIVLEQKYNVVENKGSVQQINTLFEYIDHILQFVDIEKIKPLKAVLNSGNGSAGVVLPNLLEKIPQIEAIPVFWEPDGTFPKGIPNPLLPERRADTANKIKETKADLGVAWDGDFDRCFFYDENGEFIEGYYLVAIFGEFFAKKYPGSKIIHDPRLVWATQEMVKTAGGMTVVTKSGHAFIKDRMRKEDAIYAGEMSAHHYFRDNYYADNGMIPMLLLFQILSESGKPLSALVKDLKNAYPVSGEINREVKNQKEVLERIQEVYKSRAMNITTFDGISMEFEDWRFSLRISNTEPVIRLNIETKGSIELMKQKRDEILDKIDQINSKL
ncbi:MAG: phosphomannomutase/phosphoglucomutase [Candidatus Hodarchaeales archaeon]|jgi:phosphomannomutase/phosphomannomutase/phosphoglucomutase